MRIFFCALTLGVSFTVVGCTSFSAPSYSPDYQTIDTLKKNPLEKMAVGQVQPSDPNARVNKISLRGANLVVSGGTYSSYLEQAIRSDLIEMKLFDPNASVRIDATLLKNDIDVSGISIGRGAMEVQIMVVKNGTTALSKTYQANTEFPSSFAAAVAVPKGQGEYPNLVKTLLKQVYSDPEFIQAVKKSSN